MPDMTRWQNLEVSIIKNWIHERFRAFLIPGSIRWLAMQQRNPGIRTNSPGTGIISRHAPAIINNRMKVSLMWPVISRTESRRTAGDDKNEEICYSYYNCVIIDFF